MVEFGNPHFLQSLFANDESLLRLCERTLGVRITTRDGWVKFDGDPESQADARALFERLEALRRRGVEISAPLFRMALDAAGDPETARSLEDLAEIRLLGSATRPPVTPRSLAQLEYLRALRDHEVNWGAMTTGDFRTLMSCVLLSGATIPP